MDDFKERGLFEDLLRKFKKEGHNLTVVTSKERRLGINTNVKEVDGITLLQVKTLNIQKTNLIEKGIGIIAIEYQFLKAIKKYFRTIKFDLILYVTPPVTFFNVIKYLKHRDKAFTYLLLKDIFPQNAVDLEFIKKGSWIYKYFRKKEKKLYAISDCIGCMSPANQEYLLKNNPELSSNKVEVNPNVIELVERSDISIEERNNIRIKYGLPLDPKILIYGGNLGKPQGIDFLLETISATENKDCFFLIVGSGTEASRIQNWFDYHKPKNAKFIEKLPKSEFDTLLATCDIGLLFLDKRFTIPNFPSRFLSYLEMKLPVLAATDEATDIGNIIEEHQCGYKVFSGNQTEMQAKINLILKQDLKQMGENGYQLFKNDYTVDISYDKIMKQYDNRL